MEKFQKIENETMCINEKLVYARILLLQRGLEIKIMNVRIKDLNGLKKHSHVGLYKKGHCISAPKYHLVCDYLEKINYSLQDISAELQKKPDRSVLICIIAYACWIQESVDELKKCYKSYVFNSFLFNNVIIKENTDFLKAIRSFVLAHPFVTNRHKKYGFDGTLRCIDIRENSKNIVLTFVNDVDKFYIDVNGKSVYSNQEVDYWLYIYNENKYGNMLKQYIGISIDTICKVVNDYIDYLYALDKHMSKTNIQRETN